METTRISTKGQVVLPKGLRESLAWTPGTELTVERTKDALILRPARRFPRTSLDEVVGCLAPKLKRRGKAKTIAQMNEAIGREVKHRHDSGRY